MQSVRQMHTRSAPRTPVKSQCYGHSVTTPSPALAATGPKKAYILAAGLGTRLRPLTLERPKPLVEVLGRPLVVHALQLLADAGVEDVAINSHWLHPALPVALGHGIDVDGKCVRLHLTHEPEVLGTGGGLVGLRLRLPVAPLERLLIANGDALIDLDVAAFADTNASDDRLSRLALKAVDDVTHYGSIGTDVDDRIVTFAGRVPPLGKVTQERMFCGWHWVQGRALDVLPPGTLSPPAKGSVDDLSDIPVVGGIESCINKEGYPAWLDPQGGREIRMDGFDHPGFFLDVGTPERLWEANRLLLTGEVSLAHLQPFRRFDARAGRVFVHPKARVSPSAKLIGPCVVDEDAVVGDGATVGPFAVVGPRVEVAPKVRVERAVVQSTPGGRTLVEVDAVDVHVGATLRLALAG